MKNRITELFKIEYPIIQGGMVWVSGWKLASAVSESGGLGLIGAGSMKPKLLEEHIGKCKNATNKSFGVNIPLLRRDSEELIKTTVDAEVKIVFTSAGNPAKYIKILKENNVTVVHVVSNLKQAIKAESVGCDAIVAEGVEAGGHNGADEIPVKELIKELVNKIKIPIIAAGGISDKNGVKEMLELGAEGVQIGTLFAASEESSAHPNYKEAIVKANEFDTDLFLKEIGLIRGIKNNFVNRILNAEINRVEISVLREMLGEKRERLGIFEGDVEEGILEAGTGIGKVNAIIPVAEIFKELI